jgi:hypothetical protein
MTAFISHLVSDVRHGHDSWRVLLTVTVPAFLLSCGAVLAR